MAAKKKKIAESASASSGASASAAPAEKTIARTPSADRKWKEAIWEAPGDVDRLRVWADFLLEQGDPRGEVLQLRLLENPTDEQAARVQTLMKKHGGALVGPARPWLRYWSFDPHCLVNFAICEAPKLIEGWEEIAWLHPRLTLEVTSLSKRTMATIAELVELPLSRIYLLRLESNALTDKSITALGPALRGMRNLSLSGNKITAAGLVALAPYLGESIEYLCLGAHVSDPDKTATCNGYAKAIVDTPAFHNLQAVSFYAYGRPDDEHLKLLRELPRMKSAEATSYPPFAAGADRLKSGAGPEE